MNRTTWKFLAVVAALALLILGLTACQPQVAPTTAPAARPTDTARPQATQPPAPTAAPTKAPEKVLVVAAPYQYSETLDIAKMVYSAEYTNMVYEGLISVDYDYQYKPGLAESWEVSPDGTVVTFHLKKGVKFHDGSEFNAGVVKWWIELMQSDESCCSYLFTPVTKVEATDNFTVVLTMENPFPNLFFNLSSAWGLIMSQEAYEKYGADYGTKYAVGTGPFMLEEWVPNDHLTLVKNPDYNWAPEWTGHKGPANVDKIIYRIIPEDATRLVELEAGDVQVLLEAPWRELPTYQNNADYQVVQGSDATLWFVGMNLNEPLIADLRARVAIGNAIDRELIQQTLYLGLGSAKTTYLASELGGDKGVAAVAPRFDPAAAAKLLAEAGWQMGGDGVLVAQSVAGVPAGTRFEVSFLTYQDDEAKRLAEVVQNMLGKVGIKANIQQMDNPTYADKLKAGGHQIILRRYTWDNNDIIDWFHSGQYLPYPNYLGVNDPAFDQMMLDANYAIPTWDGRDAAYQELHRHLIQKWYPWAPIFQRPVVMLARSSVQNLRAIPLRGLNSPDVWTLIDLKP